MKKRILSGLMTLVMALSLLPTAALADESSSTTHTTEVSYTEAENPVIVKSVNEDGTELTLEAYVTGEPSNDKVTKPTDIVLVLDQSGSMKWNFKGDTAENEGDSRQSAMKKAVNEFIEKVAASYDKDTADHRMAIVTFGSTAETLKIDGKEWTAVEPGEGKGAEALKGAISDLPKEPSGSTRVDLGMEKAETLIDTEDTSRQKVVIVFTDGVPTTSNYFETGVATKAIKAAKNLKSKDVKIYTIGIFDGANPAEMYGSKFDGLGSIADKTCKGKVRDYWGSSNLKAFWSGGESIRDVDVPATNRFLNLLSNNFPVAENIGIEGHWYYEYAWRITKEYQPIPEDQFSYYMTALDSEGLTDAFKSIQNSISTVKLDENTTFSDTLSEYFTLNGNESAITVEKHDISENGENWTEDSAFKPDYAWDSTAKTVTVKNFDYAANAVVKGTDGNWSGSKLVVTIPIKVDTTCTSWEAGTNYYDTNDTGDKKAGLRNGQSEFLLTDSPKVAVTAYALAYDLNGGAFVENEEPAYTTAGNYLVDTSLSFPVADDVTYAGHKFTNWKFYNTSVDPESEITTAPTAMPANNVKAVAQWEDETTTTTYKLTYDANGGKFGDEEPAVTKKTESGLEAGSHDLKYSGEYVPTHEKQGDADVYFLGWTTTDTGDKVYGLEDKAELAKISIVSSVTISDSDVTVYAVWGVDAVGGLGDDGKDTGNQVPDVYEAWVTYKIENGYWSGNNSYGHKAEDKNSDPIVVYFKLGEKDDNTNTWKKLNPTLNGTIPTHSGNEGYTSEGAGWAPVAISNETPVTGSVEYTYYYGAVPALSITKSTTTEKAKVGEDITYTITVKNNGTAAQEDSFTVTDILPEALTLKAEGTTTDYTTSGQNITWTIDGLAAGATTTITVVATVNETAKAGDTIKNSAKIGDGEPVPGDGVEIKDDDDDYAGRIYIEKELSEVAPTNQTYTFKVYYKDANGKDVTVGTYEITGAGRKEVDIKQSVVSAASDGIFYVEEVKPADPTGYKLTKIEYAVKEVGIEFGGEINDQTANSGMENFEIVPSYSDDVPSVSVNSTVYVRNTYEKTTVTPPSHDEDDETNYYFYIQKVDAETTSKGLKGAKFGLYLDNSKTPLVTATSYSEGYAYFTLDESNYKKLKNSDSAYYKEMTAPEGYVKDDDAYPISYKDFNTSQSKAKQNAEKVLNYRTSTPGKLNDTDHFAYVIGYRDGLVRPYGLITRAETTTIFFRLLKDNVRDGNLRYSNDYADVPDTYWANIAISTMSDLGIVQGYSDGTFNPYAPITRAQFAAICARFDTDPSVQTGKQTFSDIDGHWAEGYIERAAELGWIKGFEDGTFRPDTYITRAQAMTMINRVLNRIPEDEDDLLDDMNVWPDNTPDMWCYLAVQEATNSHDFKHKSGNYETWTDMNSDPDWTRYEN